ncbi:hypothetical protein ASPZODRAFT_130151 [Penicilliopsis zonata CBS 506.65]|uniref:Uncharacterized protein n=1 Tax=Penicilliopsis zonata CBS 506.65 TaxID=1073090 RepID=A0A1L9SM71_9EURO|nr:hypothetical protein ASPZODRAFT_130151 [Penicilliopsis zonata CBS 506.65]OJJ48206.1 hypothetical protein ASPZODRAFT_130151 [Penicilliopsis zonata CBS 506.65]
MSEFLNFDPRPTPSHSVVHRTRMFETRAGLPRVVNVNALPMPGVRCPSCHSHGREVWVIPGKNCHECGTMC